jgi:hypothetical protein
VSADVSAAIHNIGETTYREKRRAEKSDERVPIECEWSKARSVLTLLSYGKVILSPEERTFAQRLVAANASVCQGRRPSPMS